MASPRHSSAASFSTFTALPSIRSPYHLRSKVIPFPEDDEIPVIPATDETALPDTQELAERLSRLHRSKWHYPSGENRATIYNIHTYLVKNVIDNLADNSP